MYLLKMPGTKKNKAGETVPLNAQKGPTCWYYAAKMVRQFHGQTWSHLSPQEVQFYDGLNDGSQPLIAPLRETERSISKVRKITTAVHAAVLENGYRPVSHQGPCVLSALLLADLWRIYRDPELLDNEQQIWQAMLQRFNVTQGAGDGTIREDLYNHLSVVMPRRMLLDLPIDGLNDRAIYRRYGFTEVENVSGSNTNAVFIRSLLKQRGPLIAAGQFSHEPDRRQAVWCMVNKMPLTMFRVQTFEDGGHAIVICGVQKEPGVKIIYADPNDPLYLFCMSLDDFKERVLQPAFLFYLPCLVRTTNTQVACDHVLASQEQG